MPRRPTLISQADIARAVRAARQAGAAAVEIRPDGTIYILVETPPPAPLFAGLPPLAAEPEIVL